MFFVILVVFVVLHVLVVLVLVGVLVFFLFFAVLVIVLAFVLVIVLVIVLAFVLVIVLVIAFVLVIVLVVVIAFVLVIVIVVVIAFVLVIVIVLAFVLVIVIVVVVVPTHEQGVRRQRFERDEDGRLASQGLDQLEGPIVQDAVHHDQVGAVQACDVTGGRVEGVRAGARGKENVDDRVLARQAAHGILVGRDRDDDARLSEREAAERQSAEREQRRRAAAKTLRSGTDPGVLRTASHDWRVYAIESRLRKHMLREASHRERRTRVDCRQRKRPLASEGPFTVFDRPEA
jgi:hypothetical protein